MDGLQSLQGWVNGEGRCWCDGLAHGSMYAKLGRRTHGKDDGKLGCFSRIKVVLETYPAIRELEGTD